MKYKIIVDKQSRKNPSNEKKEYMIDIEELRVKGDVYDSLIITKETDYVIRRLSLNESQVLTILEEPVIEPIPELNIKLFEGDNYIYLADREGNKFYAEYLIKNDFTDIYVTKNEMNSSIYQTAQNIELNVSQKLTGYSTTKEMNSAIDMKVDGITSTVNNTLKNYSTTTQMNSAIEQKADSITSSVSKSYATKNELNTAKSEIKQTTDSITSSVNNTFKNYSTTAQMNSAITQKANEITSTVSSTYATKNALNSAKSEIKQTTDSISSEVSKKVNNNEFGTKITQNANNVRIAWNNNSKNVQFANGAISLYDGEVSDSKKRATFNYTGNHFYLNGSYLGKIGTNQLQSDSSKKGLVFDLENATAYMSWSWKETANADVYAMRWTYASKKFGAYEANTLNAGCNIDMHGYTLKNVSFEGGGITGTLSFKQPLEVETDGTLKRWSTATLKFQNGILVSGSWG